jgi:hypothetical protein
MPLRAMQSPAGVRDVVQIDPASDERFGGCFLTVTEVHDWGVQGYVMVPGADGGPAEYRAEWAQIARVGGAVWLADGWQV